MGRCDEQEPRRLVAFFSSMPARLGAFSDNAAHWQLGDAAWYGDVGRADRAVSVSAIGLWMTGTDLGH